MVTVRLTVYLVTKFYISSAEPAREWKFVLTYFKCSLPCHDLFKVLTTVFIAVITIVFAVVIITIISIIVVVIG